METVPLIFPMENTMTRRNQERLWFAVFVLCVALWLAMIGQIAVTPVTEWLVK